MPKKRMFVSICNYKRKYFIYFSVIKMFDICYLVIKRIFDT